MAVLARTLSALVTRHARVGVPRGSQPLPACSPSIIPFMLDQLVYQVNMYISPMDSNRRDGGSDSVFFPFFHLLRARSNKVRQLFLFLLSLFFFLSQRVPYSRITTYWAAEPTCVFSLPLISHPLSFLRLPPISFPSDSLARPLALQ